MNSIAQAGNCAWATSSPKIRVASRHRMGRIRFPPANTEYLIAVWMEVGGTDSAGINRSSSASTAIRSSSKKSGSFIGRERQDLPISEHYSLLKPSASKGSATIFPSAFFKRISTRPSASSSCFWHSLDRPTPSSNSLMASSKESCGLSSLRTTSSRRVSDFSKSGFFGGSVFLVAGKFTIRPRLFGNCAPWSEPYIRAKLKSGIRNNSMWSGHPVQCAGPALRSAGTAIRCVGKRAEYLPAPETTSEDHETQATDPNSILRHAQEPTQSLCVVFALPSDPENGHTVAGPGVHAKALRTNRYCRCRQILSDPAENPSKAACSGKVFDEERGRHSSSERQRCTRPRWRGSAMPRTPLSSSKATSTWTPSLFAFARASSSETSLNSSSWPSNRKCTSIMPRSSFKKRYLPTR